MTYRLGIIVNPMSGRDVRRVAARAGTSAHMDKQNIVTRLALGALAQGVEEIFLAREPFRISIRAVENLPDQSRFRLIEFPVTHTNADTELIAREMWQAGCRVFIVLGGDGTSRLVSGVLPDATILPLSTGTNNVFPEFVDASVAGTAAGLVAAEKIDPQTTCRRCKRIHLRGSINDIALIDAVVLDGDQMGSLLPFDPAHLTQVLLARAEPDSVGMSPIGGYLMPCGHADDFGVLVKCGEPPQHRLTVPVSQGLYGNIAVSEIGRIELNTELQLTGPGVVAVDGDRIGLLGTGASVTAEVKRDGPMIIQPRSLLHEASSAGVLGRIR